MKKISQFLKNANELPEIKALGVLSIISLIYNFIIEALSRHSVSGAAMYLIERPLVFIGNSLIILLTLSLCLILKKRLTVFLIVSVFWLALGLTNCILLTYRTSPLSAIDFLIIKSAIGMVGIYLKIWQIVIVSILFIIFVAALIFLFFKCPKSVVNYRRTLICIAAVGVAVSMCSIYISAESKSVESDTTELSEIYDKYGFAYCFLKSLVSHGVEKPEVYNPDAVDQMLNERVTDGGEKTASTGVLPNVIFVQLESFFDINYLNRMECSENPIPNFTKLKNEGISGFLKVTSVGGGTANTEFEVLTGMNLQHFGLGEYPYTTVLKSRACESLAANLRSVGYGTHAIHNHIATFYDRHIVYASLGFDSFTPIEHMTNVSYNSLGWERDEVMTEEILAALDVDDNPDFVFAVTVQGHGQYPDEADTGDDTNGEYPANVKAVEKNITVSGINDVSEANRRTYYVNQLHETDIFIGELIEALEQRGEPCVVVFYGDHLPTLTIGEDELTACSLYETEYAVWTNTDIFENSNKYDLDLEAYRLSAFIQNLMGFSIGSITKLHQFELEKQTECDEELKTLEYMQLYDNDTGYLFRVNDMKYGVGKIEMTGWEIIDRKLYVYGVGFNRYSKVKIDRFIRDTEFIDSNTLVVQNIFSGEIDPVVVQVADDGTVLE